MLRHIFIGPARPECTDSDLSEVVTILQGLRELVPSMRALSVEKSLGLSNEGNGVVLIAEFDDQADWAAYMTAPKHLALAGRVGQSIDLDRMTVTQTLVAAD